MKQHKYILINHSPLHIGCGKDVGVIDAPILREPNLRAPYIPGSSLRGVFRDIANLKSSAEWGTEVTKNKEVSSFASKLMVGDAYPLVLPMHSLTHGVLWVTCPYWVKKLLEIDIKEGSSKGGKIDCNGDTVTPETTDVTPITDVLRKLPFFLEKAPPVLIVTNDRWTQWVQFHSHIQQRIRIDDETGVVAALFNQEFVPCESVFLFSTYALGGTLQQALHNELTGKWHQFGADAGIGYGMCFTEAL